MFVQEVLKLQVADDEPLRLSQGFLSRVLAVNQQTLENLDIHTHIERQRWGPCMDLHTARPCLTFQRTGSSLVMLFRMSSSTLNVLTTVLILNATLYCRHQWRIL